MNNNATDSSKYMLNICTGSGRSSTILSLGLLFLGSLFPTYLVDIFHIHSLLCQGHMADYSHIQWIDDLRVWWNHAVVQVCLCVDIEEPCGEFSDAVPLPVHKQAAAVCMDERADPLQDLEDHLFHIDALLHIFDQVIHDLAFFILEKEREIAQFFKKSLVSVEYQDFQCKFRSFVKVIYKALRGLTQAAYFS